jgi:hypothetical protein
MEDKQQKSTGIFASAAPFILGLVVALIFGWWVFPSIMFSEKAQPVAFKHSTHVEDQGLSCDDCHYFREDGSFAGVPATESCSNCHSDVLGDSEAEKNYVRNYVEKGKDVDWLIHQYQPDNVFFSHAAHQPKDCANCHSEFDPEDEDYDADFFCKTCHPSVRELDKLPYKENRLTGYSKTTMKMWQCERCHANPNHFGNTNANNACYTCHK